MHLFQKATGEQTRPKWGNTLRKRNTQTVGKKESNRKGGENPQDEQKTPECKYAPGT